MGCPLPQQDSPKPMTFKPPPPSAAADGEDPETALIDAERQAANFDQIRQAHQTELAEDYVELIADLIAINGEARVVELAERFGVTHATVNKVIARLQKEGLVISRPYRSIFLTDAGRDLAAKSKQRHALVKSFLIAIGVDEITAESDAEGIEHHVSDETLAAFQRVIDRVASRDFAAE